MNLDAIFTKRQARWRWGVLVPAAIALYFAGLAYEDLGLASAWPYLAVAAICLLYLLRPTYALWVFPFVGFAAYTVFTLLSPILGFEGAPVAERLVYLAMGLVPTILLWRSRPGGAA